MTTAFTPLYDRVLIKRTKEAYKGRIIIPDTAVKEKPGEGYVVAVGPGRKFENGKRQEPRVKVGDLVVFHSYVGNDVRIDGEDFAIVFEEAIGGVWEE
jgi:chaperonin GroES